MNEIKENLVLSSSISFQNLMENVDIMCYLFKYLQIKDQLKMTKISKTYRSLIVEHLWKVKHKNLAIFKINRNFVIYSNVPANNFRDIFKDPKHYEVNILNKEEINLFLQLHSNNVHKLHLWGEDWKIQVFEGFLFDLNSYEFRKLQEITYCDVCISKQNLQALCENCPKLECLHIKNFLLTKNADAMPYSMSLLNKPNIDCTLKYFPLKAMEKLEIINLENLNPNQIIKYTNLKKLIESNCCLKKLFVNQTVLNDYDNIFHECNAMTIAEADLPHCTSYKLQNLAIVFGDLGTWNIFYKMFLLKFENLQELSLTAKYQFLVLDQTTINAISKHCPSLSKLSLHYCKLNVENLMCLKSLRKLLLYFCSGLRWINLKQIVGTEMQLNEFSFDGAQYDQWFEAFEPSTSLESLTLLESNEGSLLNIFAYTLNCFENLRHLKCNKDPCDELISLQCPKLEHLQCIHSIRLWSIKGMFKQLKQLDIKVICLTWSQLLPILQHSSLESLRLELLSELALNDDKPPQIQNYLHFDFATNLKNLQIPLNVFKAARNFWLALLNYNRCLRLSTFDTLWNVINEQFLDELFGSDYFPKDMKTINFFGFEISCQELKTSLFAAIERIRHHITFYSILPHTKAKFEIIFSH